MLSRELPDGGQGWRNGGATLACGTYHPVTAGLAAVLSDRQSLPVLASRWRKIEG